MAIVDVAVSNVRSPARAVGSRSTTMLDVDMSSPPNLVERLRRLDGNIMVVLRDTRDVKNH